MFNLQREHRDRFREHRDRFLFHYIAKNTGTGNLFGSWFTVLCSKFQGSSFKFQDSGFRVTGGDRGADTVQLKVKN
jgi:hypothetical protein